MAIPNTRLSYLVIIYMLPLQLDRLVPAQCYSWPSASIASCTTCQGGLTADNGS